MEAARRLASLLLLWRHVCVKSRSSKDGVLQLYMCCILPCVLCCCCAVCKDVLTQVRFCRYVQLQLRSVEDTQEGLDRRLTALEVMSQDTSPAQENPGRERRFIVRRPRWMNRRAFASAALTVATVAGAGNHPVFKVLSMFPLLYLIPSDGDNY